MRFIRTAAQQAHPVPLQAYRAPESPFSAEITRSPVVVTGYAPQLDEGGIPVPEGGTAQNGFSSPRAFVCRLCDGTVLEPDLGSHWCEGMRP